MRTVEAPLVALVGARLFEDTGEFDFFVSPGQIVSVVGAGGSGKSTLIDVLKGETTLESGRIAIAGSTMSPEPPRRSGETPQEAAARSSEGRAYEGAGQLLSAFGLWEVRDVPLKSLSDSQLIACRLVETLLSGADIFLFDTHFDLLDPATRYKAIEAVRDLLPKSCVVVTTACPDLAEQSDLVAVMVEGKVDFLGSPEEMIDSVGDREYLIEADDRSAVHQMVDSFNVEVFDVPEGILVVALDDQVEPARLLAAGYGVVKAVWVKRPSFAEALRDRLQ